MTKVIVLTVTYGNRWKFLSQVADAVMRDSYVYKLVIVDNASENYKEIKHFADNHTDRVEIIHKGSNTGSAGGFATGLEYIKNLNCDYVLLLDDDNVPEDNFSQKFIKNLELINDKRAVILGNRNALKDNENMFFSKDKISSKIPTTFFNVFSLKKIKKFFGFYKIKKDNIKNKDNFRSIIEVESFAYGGTFLPLKAIIDSPLPDIRLFTYGDDIEYSWGVRKAGYHIYLCCEPTIKDIDLTFQDSYPLDLFSLKTLDFKIFFRMRNAALISAKNTKSKLFLILNIFVWFIGLCIYSFYKLGINLFIIKRIFLISKALYRGLFLEYKIPNYIIMPNGITI